MTFKDFQNWYCAKFQRNNPLPWQDGMQALLWYITEALPANTRATLSITSAPTGVEITGDGTDSSPYVWAFNLNRTEADDITAEKLFDLIKGSETIIVDISEDGTTLEVHLDADVINKLNRALLTPVTPPAEPAAVVINTAGAQELKPLSEFDGGDGGKLYRHQLTIRGATMQLTIEFYSTSPNKVTNYTEIPENGIFKCVGSGTSGQFSGVVQNYGDSLYGNAINYSNTAITISLPTSAAENAYNDVVKEV